MLGTEVPGHSKKTTDTYLDVFAYAEKPLIYTDPWLKKVSVIEMS